MVGKDDEQRHLVSVIQEDDATKGSFNQRYRKLEISKNSAPLMPYRATMEINEDYEARPVGQPELGLPPLSVGDVILSRDACGWPLSDGSVALILSEDLKVLGNVSR